MEHWQRQNLNHENIKSRRFYESWGAKLLDAGFLIVGTSCLAFILYAYLVDKRSLLLRDLVLFAFGAFMFGA